jgi:hypothetical protein
MCNAILRNKQAWSKDSRGSQSARVPGLERAEFLSHIGNVDRRTKEPVLLGIRGIG